MAPRRVPSAVYVHYNLEYLGEEGTKFERGKEIPYSLEREKERGGEGNGRKASYATKVGARVWRARLKGPSPSMRGTESVITETFQRLDR